MSRALNNKYKILDWLENNINYESKNESKKLWKNYKKIYIFFSYNDNMLFQNRCFWDYEFQILRIQKPKFFPTWFFFM